MSSGAASAYTPAVGIARCVQGLLLVTLLLTVVATVSVVLEVESLARAEDGAGSDVEFAASDPEQPLVFSLQPLVFIATGIAFLGWFHRVHGNLPALGNRALEYSPGKAVRSFFVPLLNFVRPLQVMREVWHGSDPAALDRDAVGSGPAARSQLGTPVLVGWWWALFLISGFAGYISMHVPLPASPAGAHPQPFSVLFAAFGILYASAAVLAIGLVDKVTEWQEQRAALIGQGGPGAPAA